MKIDPERFRVHRGHAVALADWPTRVAPYYRNKEEYQALLAAQTDHLAKLQAKFYAADRHALLVIFQAMDAAGKDGAIKHVMSGINPQGCQVFSFKHPSATELEHDFLWRTTRCLPERGRIGIFNRSYYEEVLILRVHPHLLEAEGLVDPPKAEKLWKQRYRSIRNQERHLHANGTRVVKIFLHLSREEQRQRFLARIEDPDKNWKFSEADLHERGFWDEYMQAYGAALGATSTRRAPWYAVPADDKENARLIVSEILLRTLGALKPDYPKLDADQTASLAGIGRRLRDERPDGDG